MTDPILQGQLLLGLPIALLAGVIAFASPCVLPLVPGYLGLVSSIAGGQDSRRRMLLGVALFVAGFTLVFVLGTFVVGASAEFLLRYRDVLMRVLGGVLVVMGLVFVGQLTVLQKVWKPRQVRSGGMWAAPLVGIVFAVGWTPCIGPTFAAISVLALDSGTAWQAALLGLVYSLGLGIPFLVITLGFGWASRAVGWVRRHIRAVNLVGGAVLIALGLLMLSGLWIRVSDLFQGWVGDVVTVL
ncbi:MULTISPECIES: cytochrome c biogenesis CcdA family protein [unclassified Agrococcus]|uniref:cytochrome c biogenesis CcdA family protein n=1 Tax=unclassified Agrococcus TaxID=2615065 RepID=UPI0036226F62